MPRRTSAKRATTPWRDTPRDVRPMLAELADQTSHDRTLRRRDLVFEPKYDGIRALVAVEPGQSVTIYSRGGNDKTDQFPEIVKPLEQFARRLKRPLLLDGEIVAVDEQGAPLGFQHLQGRLHVRRLKSHQASRGVSAAFIAFDLLRDGNEDLRPQPFTERRARLETRFRRLGSDSLRLIESKQGGGVGLRTRARRLGWEGLIAKDPDAQYFSGRRHAAWQKLKFIETEAFVVGGWTDPRQSRSHFGALLLGYHLDNTSTRTGRLVFAGQVGSGFSQAELGRVAALLDQRTVDDSPFVDFPRKNKREHWVRPTLVVDTTFTEWTLDGLLRNPVYVGLREDKRAKDVRLANHRPVTREPVKPRPPAQTTGAWSRHGSLIAALTSPVPFGATPDGSARPARRSRTTQATRHAHPHRWVTRTRRQSRQGVLAGGGYHQG